MQHVIAWTDVAQTTAPGSVLKQTVSLSRVSLVRVSIPAGAEAPRHHHEHEQFVQVISGAGTLTTDHGSHPFGPGSLFVFPAGTWHSATFETETVLVETNLMPG